MTTTKEQQTFTPDAVEQTRAQRGQSVEELRREEIIAYIKERVGPDLASVYDEAIRGLRLVRTGSWKRNVAQTG